MAFIFVLPFGTIGQRVGDKFTESGARPGNRNCYKYLPAHNFCFRANVRLLSMGSCYTMAHVNFRRSQWITL